ncbi:hypothetical protein [Streptomyces avermitilis]|uniref:hypothetical protein n=1 Tax=Streptomyces avermitilis TaxID=33903 RepID=UPI0036C8CB18
MWRSPPLAACPRGARRPRRPALAADGKRGSVLAYEKDPDNHIAVRGRAGPDAPSAGRVERGFEVPRTLARGAEGTPDLTSVHDGTQVRSGPYWGGLRLRPPAPAVRRGFRSWRTRPDQRLDRALEAWGTGGDIGDRSPLRLGAGPLARKTGAAPARRLREPADVRP